jgi:uncharacterized membrane protein YvbJ
MALIHCGQCGQQVDSSVDACPSCGSEDFRLSDTQRKKKKFEREDTFSFRSCLFSTLLIGFVLYLLERILERFFLEIRGTKQAVNASFSAACSN